MFSVHVKLLAIAALAAALPQAPAGTAVDPFSPNGAVGGLLQKAGNVTMGPNPKGCSKYEIVVARGTGEPGPFGCIVGDPIVAAVTKALPGSRAASVQYPANFNLNYSPEIGMDAAINRLNGQSKECPDQTFVAVGYSQGAGVWHNAFGPSPGPDLPLLSNRPALDPNVIPKIKAVVLFGDPGFKGNEGPEGTRSPPIPQSLMPVLKENCATSGDPVCDPKGTGFQNHLVYVRGAWQTDSVDFILKAFKGEPLPPAHKNATDEGWLAERKAAAAPPWTSIAQDIVTSYLKGFASSRGTII